MWRHAELAKHLERNTMYDGFAAFADRRKSSATDALAKRRAWLSRAGEGTRPYVC